MKIKGIVTQITTPEEIERGDYILTNQEVFEPGKYLVNVATVEFLKLGFFKRLKKRFRFHSKRIAEMDAWDILFEKIDFKEGDIVELEIEPVQTFSGYFEVKQ